MHVLKSNCIRIFSLKNDAILLSMFLKLTLRALRGIEGPNRRN